jgi:hypothetical protein
LTESNHERQRAREHGTYCTGAVNSGAHPS